MARVKRGVTARARHKKLLSRAKGYYNARRKVYRVAKQAVTKALQYAYIGRKQKKRQFRALWIVRINAGARQYGLSYSRMMNGLKRAGIEVDRKVLAELAVSDEAAFGALVALARDAVPAVGDHAADAASTEAVSTKDVA
jgi:large subunit ribosomal protein L20